MLLQLDDGLSALRCAGLGLLGLERGRYGHGALLWWRWRWRWVAWHRLKHSLDDDAITNISQRRPVKAGAGLGDSRNPDSPSVSFLAITSKEESRLLGL